MTTSKDRASEGEACMPHSEAPQKAQPARRETNLRIVHSNDLPLPATGRRSAWAGALEPGANGVSTHPGKSFRASERRDVVLDCAVQARIGKMLREVFSDLDNQPVPDRFVKLLADLEEKETSHE